MIKKILFFAVIACTAYAEWEDVILKPPESKSGPESVLYFGQGADLKTQQYIPILSALQDAVDFPLWIGIPQCPNNVASIPGALSDGIKRINADMVAQGMNAEKTFYGGHSLGGAMMPDYVTGDDVLTPADGMVLMGSFITRKYKTGTTANGRPQVEFPVSTLTVGGELDGLCRISRVMEALYTQVTFDEDPVTAAKQLPVSVIPGMNHMQFASGIPPSFVEDNDLQAEITEEEAHEQVVNDVAPFLGSLVYPSDVDYVNTVTARVEESTAFIQPLTDAFMMEGYEQFLPPCYCETEDEYGGLQYGTCVDTPSCNGGVTWTEQYSQVIMGGLNDPRVAGLEIQAVDSIHFVTEEDPSCHLPHIHGNPVDNANPGSDSEDTPPICENPSGCTLDLTTVTQHLYKNSGEVDIWRFHFDIPTLDTGYLPLSAVEMKTKLKSRQSIWNAAGLQDVNFTESDIGVAEGGSGDRCGEINQAAIDYALSIVPETTKARYEKYGQTMVIGEDKSTCIAGPCWIWDPLEYTKDDEANTVTIQSVYMPTENYNQYPCGETKKIPCSAGFHYCKILSPAKAVEWIYVDGLRNKLSTKK